jgi:hypothetical protein
MLLEDAGPIFQRSKVRDPLISRYPHFAKGLDASHSSGVQWLNPRMQLRRWDWVVGTFVIVSILESWLKSIAIILFVCVCLVKPNFGR